MFIHGLTGSSAKTWKCKGGGQWTRWLAGDHPTINVYTFDYKSHILGGPRLGDGGSLSDRASQLWGALRLRETHENSLVFVCHSLGGLIVKRLVHEAQMPARAGLRDVSERIAGITFIATPHDGADVARLGENFIPRLLSRAVRDLSRRDDDLLELRRSFAEWVERRSVKVFAFHETRPFRSAGIVVNRASADPQVSGCHPIAIEADHVSITKLASRDDQIYVSLAHLIKDRLASLRPPQTAPSLPDLEQRYLASKMPVWRRGYLNETGARPAADAAGDLPFEFSPRRFVELDVQVAGGRHPAVSDHLGNVRLSVSTALFDAEVDAVLITGEAGAGKTTVLTAAACAYAAAWDPAYAAKADRYDDGKWRSSSQGTGGQLPVLLSCASLTARRGSADAADGFLEAICDELSSGCGQAVTPEMLCARLKEQPYVLLLDGLDEAPLKDAQATLRELAVLQARVKADGGKLKLVVSSRPSSWRLGDDFVELRICPPTQGQADLLLRRYVEAAVPEGENASQRIRSLSAMLPKDAPLNPLFLRLQCWLALRGGEFSSSRCSLLQHGIDHLLADRRIALPDNRVLEPSDILQLLEAFARAAQDDDLAYGQLSEAAGVEIARSLPAFQDQRLDDGAATAMLSELGWRLGLFRRSVAAGVFEFTHALLCSYFEARRLTGAPEELTAISYSAAAAKRREWALAFAFSMLAKDGQEARAEALLFTLLARARAAKAQDAAAWLEIALACLSEAEPRRARADAPWREAMDRAVADIADQYRLRADAWPPRTRAELVSAYFVLARRDSHSETGRAVRSASKRLAEREEQWVRFDETRGLSFALTPVLHCDFAAFASKAAQSGAWFDHVDWPQGRPAQWVMDGSWAELWPEASNAPAKPITHVTWWEASAYCRWLTERLRDAGEITEDQEARLPTIEEWRSAVQAFSRGGQYVWGPESATDPPSVPANYRGAGLDGVSPPGVFLGADPTAPLDFGSNVSIWTTPGSQSWPPRLRPDHRAAVAGGSWADSLAELRCVARPLSLRVDARDPRVGIRPLLAPTTSH